MRHGRQAGKRNSVPAHNEPLHHIVFILREKSGSFSQWPRLLPCLANIHFPAIPTISKAFNKPIELINLTVTVYMAVQGIGKLLDADYQRVKRKALQDPERNVAAEDVTKEEYFPIEYARLQTMPIYCAIFVIATIGYGWCLHAKVPLSGPLVLQIIIGWVTMSMLNGAQTIIVDLALEHRSAITACNNLVRCSLGAAFVSVIDLILKRLGTGWTYVLLSGIYVVFSPTYWLLMKYGPKWRAARRAKRLASRKTKT